MQNEYNITAILISTQAHRNENKLKGTQLGIAATELFQQQVHYVKIHPTNVVSIFKQYVRLKKLQKAESSVVRKREREMGCKGENRDRSEQHISSRFDMPCPKFASLAPSPPTHVPRLPSSRLPDELSPMRKAAA